MGVLFKYVTGLFEKDFWIAQWLMKKHTLDFPHPHQDSG